MCGIIGIASNKSVSMNIINSLKKLEYRGYDSAGLATLNNNEINEKKCSGRVEQLEKILFKTSAEGNLGIGHVRWATHGVPNTINAHPHSTEIVSVVHNGIIENSNELKKDLENKGYKFKSQTDTEVITFLLTDFLKNFDLISTINKTLEKLNGSFALGIIFKKYNNIVVGARRGSPLAVGYGPEENYLGSDSYALKSMTNKITYLDDGDVCILTNNKIDFYNSKNKKINKEDINKLDEIKKSISRIAFTFSGQGILINRENTTGIFVRSYLQNDIDKIDLIKNGIIDGSLNSFNKNTISIGKELAISMDLLVGDEITLMSTSNLQTPFGNLPLQEKFKISSIFSTGLAEFDQNVIFIPFENANSLFETSDMDINLEIFLNKPDKVQLIKQSVQKIFSNHYVYTWEDLNKSFFGALKVERNVMFIILTLIIIVAAFNIISGLTILVKNKTKEIAILRTLGISKTSIAKIFFIIGFTIGFLATITGVTIGILFSYYIEEIRVLITSIFNIRLFPEEIYFLSQMPSEINLGYIIIISLFSLLITFLATIFPSLSAAKLDPIKALKYE